MNTPKGENKSEERVLGEGVPMLLRASVVTSPGRDIRGSYPKANEELPPYLTVGLHGVRDSIIIVTLPKYVPVDGYIDANTLEEDGYSCVVKFEGDYERCFIESLKRGDAMKVEIIQSSPTSTKGDEK